MNRLFGIQPITTVTISGVALAATLVAFGLAGRSNEVLIIGTWVVLNIAVFLPWFGLYQERAARKQVDHYANHLRRHALDIKADAKMANLWWDQVNPVRDWSLVGATAAVGGLMSLAAAITDHDAYIAYWIALGLAGLALLFVPVVALSYWRRKRKYEASYKQKYHEAFAEARKESLTPA